MNNCAECKKQIVRTFLMCVLDVKPSELAEELHVSRCHISNMLAERRDSKELNEYLFNRIFSPKASNLN